MRWYNLCLIPSPAAAGCGFLQYFPWSAESFGDHGLNPGHRFSNGVELIYFHYNNNLRIFPSYVCLAPMSLVSCFFSCKVPARISDVTRWMLGKLSAELRSVVYLEIWLFDYHVHKSMYYSAVPSKFHFHHLASTHTNNVRCITQHSVSPDTSGWLPLVQSINF